MEDDPFLINLSFNVIVGGEGGDLMLGSIGPDMHGGTDIMLGLGGDDTMYGYWGDDSLDGGEGADHMEGHSGNDNYFVDDPGDVVKEFANEGIDEVFSTVDYTLPEHVEDLSLFIPGFTATGTNAQRGTGNGLDNTIVGNNAFDNLLEGLAGDDRLFGLDGDDELRGGSDNDSLFGDDGNDRLYGGSHGDSLFGGNDDDLLDGGTGGDKMRGELGNDDYYVNEAGDHVIEEAGQGQDEVFSYVSYTLSDNVEDLTLLDGAADGTGNALDNGLVGNDADNTLDGRGGADRMFGGRGNDTYYVDNVGDIVVESVNAGIDRVNVSDLASYTLTAFVENLNLLTGSLNGIGNSLDNAITGNALDNTIDGGLGDDTLSGGDGSDTVSFASWDPSGFVLTPVAETIRIELGQGSTQGSATWSVGLVTIESDTIAGFENVRGSNRAETIVGNGASNRLEGRGGADVLQGNGGSDILDGGSGADTASYESNARGVIVILGDNGSAGQALEFGLVNGVEQPLSADTLISIEHVRGSAFSDTLIGNAAVNELRGNNGNDTLNGLGGADTLIGGIGNDTYFVDVAGDKTIELAGQGADEVRTSVSYTLNAGASIEIFRTTDDSGTLALDLTGNELGNIIVGNNGVNTIQGGGGGDQIIGGRGADTLTGGANADLFIWRNTNETGVTVATMDRITDFDFAAGDRIDLSQVDPSVFDDGIIEFTFIGQSAFSGTPGEINYVHLNGETIIQMQTGVGADIEGGIRLAGIVTPEANWFIL